MIPHRSAPETANDGSCSLSRQAERCRCNGREDVDVEAVQSCNARNGQPSWLELPQRRKNHVVAICKDSLHFVSGHLAGPTRRLLWGSEFTLSQARSSAMLTGDAPETIREAAVGRRVDEVFDYPVLAGRGYVIVRSGDYVGDVPSAGDRPPWRVVFRARRVPWRVPWAEGGPEGSAA